VSVERKVGKLPLLASLRNAGCAYFFTVVVVNAIALGFNTSALNLPIIRGMWSEADEHSRLEPENRNQSFAVLGG